MNCLAHEAGHAVAAIATGGRVLEFRASRDGGGHVQWSGVVESLIGVAPYTVPMLALLVAGVCTGFALPANQVAAAILGTAFGYHLVVAVSDLRAYLRSGRTTGDSDLRHFGPFGTATLVAAANLWWLGVFTSFIAAGPGPGVSRFLVEVLSWNEYWLRSLLFHVGSWALL
jgi:hypothetical protein